MHNKYKYLFCLYVFNAETAFAIVIPKLRCLHHNMEMVLYKLMFLLIIKKKKIYPFYSSTTAFCLLACNFSDIDSYSAFYDNGRRHQTELLNILRKHEVFIYFKKERKKIFIFIFNIYCNSYLPILGIIPVHILPPLIYLKHLIFT